MRNQQATSAQFWPFPCPNVLLKFGCRVKQIIFGWWEIGKVSLRNLICKTRNFGRKTCRGCIQKTAIATSRAHVRSDIIAVPWLMPTFHSGGPEFSPKSLWGICFGRSGVGTRFFQSISAFTCQYHSKNYPHSYFKLTSTLHNLNNWQCR